MFDYHMHSSVSFDSTCDAKDIVEAAEKMGLKEICFTDHYDFCDDPKGHHNLFTMEQYMGAYGDLTSEKVKIRRGVEFGLTPWNAKELEELLDRYHFDFVIGSVHFADGYDPYCKEYWAGCNTRQGFEKYLNQVLACVKVHRNFDVLGHLNYVSKSIYNPTNEPLRYEDYADICDEIMKILVANGKGMEINTSGVDRIGEFLPSYDFIKRFKELGGEIVTVGSDAHDATRVGQYIPEALKVAKDVFGYVCTFENRKPLTIGIPTDEEFDFQLDCASSITQNGKVEYYERIGEELCRRK